MDELVPERKRRASRYGYEWLIGFFVIGVLLLLARHRAEPEEIARVVANARPVWLLLAVVLQLATYPCIAVIWATAIRYSGNKSPSFATLLRLAVAELFADQTIPSGGMSGTVLVVASLEKRGVEPAGAMAAVIANLAGFYVAQLAAVTAAFAVMIVSGHFGRCEATVCTIALGTAIVLPVPLVLSLAGAINKLPARLQRLRFVAELREHIAGAPKAVIFSPRVFIVATVMRFVVLVLDGATLALSLVAVGSPLQLVNAVSAYVLAYVVGTASFLPGGIGPFEVAASTLLADLGAPLFAAAPATLLMRALSFWLPMIPGLWLVQSEVKRRAR